MKNQNRAAILLERANTVLQYHQSLQTKTLETLWHDLDDPEAPGGMRISCIPINSGDCIADVVQEPVQKRDAFEYILQVRWGVLSFVSPLITHTHRKREKERAYS